jgi:hypothetical protein
LVRTRAAADNGKVEREKKKLLPIVLAAKWKLFCQ